jgi:hypothetical protein
LTNENTHIVSILKLCGIDVSIENVVINSIQKKILAYPNPDGTIRWMWDAESTKPLFLKFYGVIGWKSKLFSAFVQLLFVLKLQKIIAKKCVAIYLDTENSEKYNSLLGVEWALFTGTPGKLRKAVITIHKKSESVFLKIPLTDAAKNIVALESKNLSMLEKLQLQNSIVPKGIMYGISLQQTDVSQYCSHRSSVFGNLHLLSMIEFFEKTNHKKSLSSTLFWQIIEKNITVLINSNSHPDILIWNELLKNLMDEKNKIDASTEQQFCLAHADLTAWNCYCDDSKLYIYDWELAIEDAPVLYDLFHFHIQGNCLLGNQSFEQIEVKLNQVLQSEKVKAFCKTNNIDVELNLKLYLLYHVSVSLCWYAEQKDLHLQVQWLTALWNKYLTKK